MKRLLLFFLFLFFASSANGEGKSPTAIFQEANAAYREGNYSRAASLYESLIEKATSKDPRQASLYYNLGNAYFKQERLGLAILYYEKAKRLSPRDRDLAENLKYAKGLLEYRIEDKRNWYLKMGEAFLTSFTPEEVGIVALLLGLLFLASWVLPLYTGRNGPWGWKRKTLLVLALGCLSVWGLKGIYDTAVREAIVLEPQAPVRYGPAHKDQVAFRLGEGMKVWVKKTTGEWSQVVLTNGETGWMFQESMGVI